MHSPTSLLVRMCEKELYQFAKTPIEHEGTWGHMGLASIHVLSSEQGDMVHLQDHSFKEE